MPLTIWTISTFTLKLEELNNFKILRRAIYIFNRVLEYSFKSLIARNMLIEKWLQRLPQIVEDWCYSLKRKLKICLHDTQKLSKLFHFVLCQITVMSFSKTFFPVPCRSIPLIVLNMFQLLCRYLPKSRNVDLLT